MSSEDATVAAHLALASAVHEWCLRGLEREERRRDLSAAAEWAVVAGLAAHRSAFSHLCSPALEHAVARLGARSPAIQPRRRAGPRRWLHVLSAAPVIGGHTSLIRRWVGRNPHRDIHDLLMTAQPADTVDPRLREAIRQSGGRVVSVFGQSVMSKAWAVGEAASSADVVVLTIFPNDVAPLIAFGGPGGPPVALVNHQDHAFWTGTGIVDVVIDHRTSGQHLTTRYRGAAASAELPVPLEDKGPAKRTRAALAGHATFLAGDSAGPLLLTIGRSLKYSRTPRLDFPSAVEQVLRERPDARLVAVGPTRQDPGWRELVERTGGRVTAVGEQIDLGPWHAAADVYLEGFPIGSYTALLETALAERAIVRKPLLMSPAVLPVDQGALAGNRAPETPADYTQAVIGAIDNEEARYDEAARNRDAVLRHHCGDAWDARLTELRIQLTTEHVPRPPASVPPLPRELCEYWYNYGRANRARDPFIVAFLSALERGLRPRVDRPMYQALDAARDAEVLSLRPAKALVGSWGLSFLPARVARSVYEAAP